MKKRIFFIALIVITIAAVVPLSGCNKSAEGVKFKNNGYIKITTAIFPHYDFVRAVGGERVDLIMMIPAGYDSHNFEPGLRNLNDINASSLLVCNGGEADRWLNNIQNTVKNKDLRVIEFLGLVELLEEEEVEGMTPEEEEDGEEGDMDCDEHVWTSPKNVIAIVEAIRGTLCELDPENAEYFTANAAAYTQNLEKLDADIREVVDNGARKTLVVGDRFPFLYFVREYGLHYYAALKGCSYQTEPSLQSINFLHNKVVDERIPVIFYIDGSNKNTANLIATKTDAVLLELNSCHNIGYDDFSSGKTYIDIMYRNVAALKTALN